MGRKRHGESEKGRWRWSERGNAAGVVHRELKESDASSGGNCPIDHLPIGSTRAMRSSCQKCYSWEDEREGHVQNHVEPAS